jgi:hypothetical protein
MVSELNQSHEEIVAVMCTGCEATSRRSDCCTSRGNGDRSGMQSMSLHHLKRWSDCSSEVCEEEAQRTVTTVSDGSKHNGGLDNSKKASDM